MVQVADDPGRTKLTAFLELCQTDDLASGLLHPNVPRFFTWKLWERRKQGKPDHVPGVGTVLEAHVVTRVATIHPLSSECYHLRLLLHKLRGPTSFAELNTVNSEVIETFKEACRRRGLLESDEHFDLALEETAL